MIDKGGALPLLTIAYHCLPLLTIAASLTIFLHTYPPLPSLLWFQGFTSQGKDPCLDLWAKDFTSKIEVKISAFEVKIRAYEVKSCAYEVKIRAFEVKSCA